MLNLTRLPMIITTMINIPIIVMMTILKLMRMRMLLLLLWRMLLMIYSEWKMTSPSGSCGGVLGYIYMYTPMIVWFNICQALKDLYPSPPRLFCGVWQLKLPMYVMFEFVLDDYSFLFATKSFIYICFQFISLPPLNMTLLLAGCR